MQLRSVLVVVMLLLAGCSAFGTVADETATDDGPTATSSETSSGSTETTTSSTPVKTTTSSTPVNVYAPGVSETGLENVDALLAAQDDALADTAHVTELRVNVTGQVDGEAFEQRTHTLERVDADGTLVYTDTRSGPEPTEIRTLSIYGDEETGIGKQSFESDSANGTQFLRGVSASHLVEKKGGTFFATYIESGAFRVVNVSGSGADERIRLEATEVSEAVASDPESSVSDYRGTIVLGGDGIIRSVDISFTVGGAENGRTYAIDFDQSVGGEVNVSRPAWYDTVRLAVVDLDVRALVTGIRLTNTGGTAIDTGQTIHLSEGGADSRTISVPERIEPGETVYLTETASGQLQIETTKPSVVTSLSGTYRLELIDGEVTVLRKNVTFP